MKQNPLTIGLLIDKEVRRQQIDIAEFAKMIHTTRGNAYNIFERNDFKIDQLRQISKILGHNFFEDIAEDLDLAMPVPVDEEELKRLRAVSQFLDFVPAVFAKLNLSVAIVNGTKDGLEKEIPIPDFILSDFNITFTKGQNYQEKCNGYWGNGVAFYHIENSPANMVGYMKNNDGIQFLDIAIDLMTEDEWEQTIRFALEYIESFYLPRTWSYLSDLKR